MSAMAVLLLLLVLAYIGSLWASSHKKRAFGSPSGVEYVVLGALLGPHALGALGQEALAAFTPIGLVALGWIGLGYGLECGLVRGRRAKAARIALGAVFKLIVAVAAGFAVDALALRLGSPWSTHHLLLSAAVALVCPETTRHTAQWISERYHVQGPLSELIEELSAADDAPVLLTMALAWAWLNAPHVVLGITVSPWATGVGTLALGAVVGLMCGYLCARTPSPVERWGIVLGSALIAIGITDELRLSAISATFVLGLSLSIASPQPRELRDMVDRTEGTVLLPALLLAGARLELPASRDEMMLIAVALAARALTSMAIGGLVSLTLPRARGVRRWIGLGMMSSGTLTMVVALTLNFRFPGEIGRVVLTLAASATLLGEIIGRTSLVRGLSLAGELTPREESAVLAEASAEVSAEVSP